MQDAIVSGIADGDFSCVVSIGCSPSAVIIIDPFALACIIPLLSDICACVSIFACVCARHDARVGGVGEPFGSVCIIKCIDDECDRCFSFIADLCADGGAWETKSSFIARYHIAVVLHTWFERYGILCIFHLLHFPFSSVLLCIE